MGEDPSVRETGRDMGELWSWVMLTPHAGTELVAMIRQLGVNGGVGFAYEYAGEAVRVMTMDERMTLCNLSIEVIDAAWTAHRRMTTSEASGGVLAGGTR